MSTSATLQCVLTTPIPHGSGANTHSYCMNVYSDLYTFMHDKAMLDLAQQKLVYDRKKCKYGPPPP